jgi:hypothetical protein
MIRMQKKAVAKAEDQAINEAPASKESSEEPMAVESSEGKVSLLGIGGRQIGGAGTKPAGKRRTPGEIRIQKGLLLLQTPYRAQPLPVNV